MQKGQIMYRNKMHLEFESKSENEKFARVTAAAFITGLDPTMEEISDLKTAVSEAVTNAIVHGYEGGEGMVHMEVEQEDRTVTVTVWDDGVGIEDIPQAMEPLYTTKPEDDRAGMGFMFMEAFMDELQVFSEVGKGTRVIMKKTISER